MYELNGHFPIANVINISLNGISSGNKTVMISCTNDKSFMSIYNSSIFELHNITLINCGTSLMKAYNISLPATTSAALLLYNVLSVTVTGVVFTNSHGHGIVAYNVTGKFIMDTIKITQDRTVVTPYTTGGLILVFVDNKLQESKRQNVLINNDSVAIGIAFHQRSYSVNIQVQYTNISNLTSYKGSHIFVSYKQLKRNVLGFISVLFTTNTNRHQDFSIFETHISKLNNSTNFLSIIVSGCSFLHNAMVFWQPAKWYSSVLAVKMTINLSSFSHNRGIGGNPGNMRFDMLLAITIKQCKFLSNEMNIEFNRISTVIISGRNIFQNNTAKKFLLQTSNSYPIFDGYHEFSLNTANTILSLYRYVSTEDRAVINITNNRLFSNVHKVKEKSLQHLALLHFGTRHTLFQCPFQIVSNHAKSSYQPINVSITIRNNTDYQSAVYGTQLNSCYWQNGTTFNLVGMSYNHTVTPGTVYRKVFNIDENQQIIRREGAILCTCKNTMTFDCFNDHIAPAYPGETITINVTLLPPHPQIAVYIDSSTLLNNSISPPCEIPLSRVNLVARKCTSLVYKIVSKYPRSCSVYLKTMATSKPETLFVYYITLKACPPGFQHINGLCICNQGLLHVFPSLMCDIDTQMITRPMNSWIGTDDEKSDILYVEYCIAYFCLTEPSDIHLHHSDTQCVNNRVGVMCGHCPPGFDSVFGSLKCKQCSNVWLLLLPVFLIAGAFIVVSLFTLNLTVADGKINGFLLYANSMVGNSYNIFPTRNILFVLMSMCNLDLGIETCFYHGMTEYDKTWLQFAFPFYLFCIVAILVITSRHFKFAERLTRRRAIPVIATIMLLSYNKLLMATTKALFSYKSVYRLNDNNKQVIWMWDSSLSLLSAKFILLFLAGSITFLFIILPLNFLLLFTRCSYRLTLVSKYLKPFLDAYQAPLKDNCRYFLGQEFIVRCTLFIFGNRILDFYETLAVLTLINVTFLLYICAIKPFKSTFNTVLYVSFACNTQGVLILLTFTNYTASNLYHIIFYILVIIALLEFGGVILYCICINHLRKNGTLSGLFSKFIERYWSNLSQSNKSQMEPSLHYEEFRDELQEFS